MVIFAEMRFRSPVSRRLGTTAAYPNKNGVAVARLDSSPTKETPSPFRRATAVGRAALC
jgi:hypothetical protein